MARLDVGVTRSQPKFQVPWKVVLLVCTILGIWGFIAYKYVQYRVPTRTVLKASKKTAVAKPPVPKPDRLVQQMTAGLALTAEQKQQLSELAKTTTSPKELRVAAMKILTPEQRKLLRERQEELRRRRADAQTTRQQRLAKYYGSEADYARRADAAIRQQRQQRRQQLEAAGATTATRSL